MVPQQVVHWDGTVQIVNTVQVISKVVDSTTFWTPQPWATPRTPVPASPRHASPRPQIEHSNLDVKSAPKVQRSAAQPHAPAGAKGRQDDIALINMDDEVFDGGVVHNRKRAAVEVGSAAKVERYAVPPHAPAGAKGRQDDIALINMDDEVFDDGVVHNRKRAAVDVGSAPNAPAGDKTRQEDKVALINMNDEVFDGGLVKRFKVDVEIAPKVQRSAAPPHASAGQFNTVDVRQQLQQRFSIVAPAPTSTDPLAHEAAMTTRWFSSPIVLSTSPRASPPSMSRSSPQSLGSSQLVGLGLQLGFSPLDFPGQVCVALLDVYVYTLFLSLSHSHTNTHKYTQTRTHLI